MILIPVFLSLVSFASACLIFTSSPVDLLETGHESESKFGPRASITMELAGITILLVWVSAAHQEFLFVFVFIFYFRKTLFSFISLYLVCILFIKRTSERFHPCIFGVEILNLHRHDSVLNQPIFQFNLGSTTLELVLLL